jgi:hypothetical protein
MPDVQLRMIVKCLGAAAAGVCLSACSLLSTSDHVADKTLPPAIISPIAADAAEMRNVTGFDIYVDGETLHAVFSAAGGDAKLPLIGYLHSEDGGRHWSKPQEIGKPFALPVESKIGNDIQIAASGDRILVMWQTTGELPGMGPLVSIYSNDAGKTWQKGANPTGSETDQSHHDLAADPQGRFHLVWLDDRDENGYQGLRYARSADVGQHWEFAQTIDDSSCSCCWNRLSISADGQINALYRDMEPRDMALAQSGDAGQTWQRLSTVGAFDWKFDGCPHNGGGLSQAENGPVHSVVWTGAENRAGLYHMQSTDGGKNWSSPQAVAADSGAFHGDIAALDEKRVALIWDAMGPEGSTVLAADSADNGAVWSAPRQLSSPGVSASHPRIVATGSGWLAMWTEQKSKTSRQWLSAVIQ